MICIDAKDYKTEVRKGTDYELSTDDYNRKFEALNSKRMRVQLRHKKDVKFRKDCENYENFYVHIELLEKTLDNHIPLKAWLLNVFYRLNT